ncbi:hypothetical protein Val02_93120 [Virgisporangium aliadipatigenens]|uniref:Uncharacterized protein n=1 Tax=Virgisporangium aliadipatigenens TaxID=741659 RepID=A0A8J3YVN6_9ACTN|nr:hypothetical protein [Virgisporangium aliadipatigenens]GIJ52426.1 hypothetical protein Val02_93120 [Virgisporangium aliadipatigenens]
MDARERARRLLRRGGADDTGRLDDERAERLLDGTATDDPDGLAALLADARGPARPDELTGEAAALAAFRHAHAAHEPAPLAAGEPRHRRRLALALTGAAAALLLGGTAYAAGTGRLPDGLQRTAHDLLSGVGVPAPPTTEASGTATQGAPALTPSPAPRASAVPTPTPTPDATVLIGLCRSWAATATNPNAKAISAEDLRILAAAAGGEAAIGAYCERLTAGPSAAPTPPPETAKPGNGATNTRKPSHAGKPDDD